MAKSRTFSVKNFDQFQHYKDRTPPWIKLYNSVLDDYAFTGLPDASRAHLLSIWLLASRLQNVIPFDAEWVKTAIKASGNVNLDELVDAGFIIPSRAKPHKSKAIHDSTTLADCKQDARPERETEREGETDCSVAKATAAEAASPSGVDWNDEAAVFRYGKRVLGKQAGGMIVRLKQEYEHDLEAVLDILEQASEKADPREWVGGVLKNISQRFHGPYVHLTTKRKIARVCPPEIYRVMQ